mgnify:FL=1
MKKTYNRAMIELVYEIRRRIESEHKPNIKLANPDLLMMLVIYYQHCDDTILKALIKELMMYAGERWVQRLHDVLDAELPEHKVNVYRGSVSFEETSSSPTSNKPKPELIYRGRVVKR